MKAVKTFVILCTGPSLSQALVDRVSHLPLIAVNRSFELAPHAVALVGNDQTFWDQYPEAHKFSGRKFSACAITTPGVDKLRAGAFFGCNTNSGLVAVEAARMLGGDQAIMLGLDFHGTHYFGSYEGKCRDASEARRAIHAKQFADWMKWRRDFHKNKGIQIINCTKGSALKCLPSVPLEEMLSDIDRRAVLSKQPHAGRASQNMESLQPG